MSASQPLQFAYWVPNVSGGLVISQIEQRTRWDAAYNRKLAQIAEQAGFGSPEALRHHFRQRFNTTPTKWRKAFNERVVMG